MIFIACSSEDANDCIQNAGTTIQEEIVVEDFDKILVNRGVRMIIEEASENRVVVETGEYLLNDIVVEVVNGQLQLTNNNTCNYVRDYGITKIYVFAPNIGVIRTSSQYTISSNGTLNYNNLRLLSENFNAVGTFTVGDINLTINSNNLSVVSNNISSFNINGNVENLSVSFYSGTGRFEGRSLVAQDVEIYHRASNDIVVNPQSSLTGQLLGTGNLISVNRPTTVDVEQLYTGRLIFD